MKRKNFSNLKIETLTEKTIHFKHEGFIAGAPPFLRGINSFTTKTSNLKQKSLINQYDINTINLENELEAIYLKKDKNTAILLTNNNQSNAKIQVAELLVKATTIIKNSISKKIEIDTIAPSIYLGWNTTNNLPFEVAKIRATRVLWAKFMLQFKPKNQHTLALKILITNNNSTANLIAETSGAEIHNANSEISNYFKNETFISKTIDPWAGSTVVEKLTENFYTKTWDLYLNLGQKQNN